MFNRGLIIAADVTIDIPDHRISGGLHQKEFWQKMVHWALMWDQIAIPVTGMPTRVQEMQFLVESGFAVTCGVPLSGKMEEIGIQTLQTIMLELEARDPGKWATAVGPGAINLINTDLYPQGDLVPDRGALVTLTNLIPVPDRDVPLAEIFEFKQKRSDELLALRHHLDGIFFSLGAHGDTQLAINSAIGGLTSSVNDYTRVLRERQLPFRLSTELFSCNIVSGAIAAAPLIAAHAPLATILSNAAGAAIAVSAGLEWVKRRNSNSPFKYISRYSDELFGDYPKAI